MIQYCMLRQITLIMSLLAVPCFAQESAPAKPLDVPYVPTPQEVVDEMLKMANVHTGDIVYDLGCGDGRIVVTAAQKYGTRGVGVDLNPERIKEAKENAEKAGVANLVTFREGDLFQADISEATVVTLYLLPSVNEKLRPKLWRDLKSGSRVVSHNYDMGDWKPEKETSLDEHSIFFWTITQDVKQKAGTR
jgi:precorrin-6B methylase 2